MSVIFFSVSGLRSEVQSNYIWLSVRDDERQQEQGSLYYADIADLNSVRR